MEMLYLTPESSEGTISVDSHTWRGKSAVSQAMFTCSLSAEGWKYCMPRAYRVASRVFSAFLLEKSCEVTGRRKFGKGQEARCINWAKSCIIFKGATTPLYVS